MANLIYNAIEKNQNDMIEIINSEQPIRRYLKYLSNNPLAITSEQIDIKNSLIGTNIILDMFDSTVEGVADCKLYFYFIRGNFNDESTGDFYYGIDIICNQKYWKLDGMKQWRYARIMDRIESLFNNKYIISIGRTRIINTSIGHITGTNYNICRSELKLCNSTRGTH